MTDYKKDNFTISSDPARLDVDAICDMLSRAYWSKNRSRQTILRTLEHSLCFGVYDGERQVGFARVVTDYTIFAWLCDVYIHEDYRGRGLSKWLMEVIMNHPLLQGLRRWALVSRDARGLYQQSGFTALNTPERWMEKFDPNA